MWKAYDELAWTEAWLEDPAGVEEEVASYHRLLKEHAGRPVREVLHLGCGAGAHDRALKRHFRMTGVDLNAAMLTLARRTNPEVEYHQGDMRSVRLGRRFDAVVIPDSIDYMASREELALAFETARHHLHPGGALLVVAKPRELFHDNNFAYVGERDGIHITVLENNYVLPPGDEQYEATLVYLIRQGGELDVQVDHHRLGLFSQATWEQAFRDQRLDLHQQDLEGIYEPFMIAEGEYPMRMFICVAPGGQAPAG